MLVETAASFATIVGLINDFVAGRGQRNDAAEIGEFLAWLSSHGFGELVARIEKNHAATLAIKAVLSESRDALLEKFGVIEKQLATIAASVPILQGAVTALVPSYEQLSDQAVALLCAFETAKSGKGLEHRDPYGSAPLTIMFIDTGGHFEAFDDRFIEDDLSVLLSLKLLTKSSNSRGQRVFHPSRLGSEIATAYLKSRARVG